MAHQLGENKTSLKEGVIIFAFQLLGLIITLSGIGLLIRIPLSINTEEGLMNQQPAVAMGLLGIFCIIIGIALEKKVKKLFRKDNKSDIKPPL